MSAKMYTNVDVAELLASYSAPLAVVRDVRVPLNVSPNSDKYICMLEPDEELELDLDSSTDEYYACYNEAGVFGFVKKAYVELEDG